MKSNLAQLAIGNEQPLGDKIAEAEARAAESLAEERHARTLADRPSGLERLFGRPGQPQRYLAPQHLLHTLPPDYPLSMAIGFLMSFSSELEVYLQEGEEQKTILESIITEHQPILMEMKNSYLQLRTEHDKSLFKFRYRKRLTEMAQEIFAAIKRARDKNNGLQPENTCPAQAVDNFLHSTNLSLQNTKEQIATVDTDLKLYQLRTAELIDQYFEELALIPQKQLQVQLESPGQAQLHARIVRAKEDLDLPVPL